MDRAPTGTRSQAVQTDWGLLRATQAQDAELLLRWRNDPTSVRFSRSRAAVSTTEHRAWFASRLERADRQLWIAEEEGKAVGQVRIDVSEGVGEVAIGVDPKARGRGYAGRMLRELLALVEADGLAGALIAEVDERNLPSLRAFRRAGFAEVGRQDGFIRLRRELSCEDRTVATGSPPP